MELSKSQINKLGRTIRTKLRENQELNDNELLNLQAYRTSFKDDVSEVFRFLGEITKRYRKDSIVSYRIKRIESILSKINREQTMSLGNMGDIAGCRIIVYTKAAKENIIETIKQNFKVHKINDYSLNPKADGYKGYHLYVKSPLNENKLIEIQLRLISTHKWASLVEIIDILYDTKIKEGEENKDLDEFLYILSLPQDNISVQQKERIIEIDYKFKIYTRLSEVFLQNHIAIRSQWLDLCENGSHFYFIFEVDADKSSKISSFEKYDEAESKYFDMFLTHRKSNFVLAFIEKPNFKRICIAYSSYMMVKHNYLDDYWNDFAKEVITNSPGKEDLVFADLVTRNLTEEQKLILSELEEIRKRLKPNEILTRGLKEWIEELETRVNELNKKTNEIKEMTNNSTRKNIWDRMFN